MQKKIKQEGAILAGCFNPLDFAHAIPDKGVAGTLGQLMTRHHLMTSVKNEAVYLLEWIAHHKAIGFDAIFIAANNCTDGTQSLLRALHRAGAVKHLKNNVPEGKIPQHHGYAGLRARFDVDACDWLMILDVDEFLHVDLGAGGVSDLTAQVAGDVDIIALNALNFGTGLAPTAAQEVLSVTRRFNDRLPNSNGKNRTFKCLTRNPVRFKGAHNHHLVKLDPPADLTVMRGNGTCFSVPAGTKLWNVLRHSKPSQITHEWAHYKHYGVKSWREFRLRQVRGNGALRGGQADTGRYSRDYFLKRARGGVVDNSISKYAAKTQDILDDFLSDPAVKAAQDTAVEKFFARIGDV